MSVLCGKKVPKTNPLEPFLNLIILKEIGHILNENLYMYSYTVVNNIAACQNTPRWN